MNFKKEFQWLILIALFSFLVFANALRGEFVYDDNRQIVRNTLIQNPTLYGKALTSDVWAFKGDGTVAASNYWRPTFVAWMILNFRLFGLSPFGWHLLNILLHVGVCLLAYLLLRRWNLSPAVAFAISIIFAVHPVHTESVAWISGAPDLLFSLFLLASLWFTESFSRGRKNLDLLLALIFYALALGAKEIGILCFPLFVLILMQGNQKSEIESEPEKNKKHKKKHKSKTDFVSTGGWNAALPFLGLAIVYFVLRALVLGEISQSIEDAASIGTAILSVPSIFVFYVRQLAFPYAIAANYPIRAVASISFFNFVIPLIISAAILFFLWLAAKRSFVQKMGLALFVLPLLPAMNASAFIPEQIVHDRYLYLPLLGFLMVIFPYLAELVEQYAERKKDLIIALAAIVLCLPLVFVTFTYNKVWLTDLSLWEHSVQADSSSSFNWSQYGSILAEQKKIPESIEAYNNALKIKQSASALMGQARNLLAIKRYDEALKFLKPVIEKPDEKINAYTLYQSYESLAIVLITQKKYDEAERYLIEARRRLPIYSAALTEKLAVVYYQSNRKEDALRELEAAKDKARSELLVESKSVLLRLGQLYAELGRKDEARTNLQEFLSLTGNIKEENTLQERRIAAEILNNLH